MTPQEILQKFISRQLSTLDDGRPVVRFELFHASGEQSERLQIFPIITGETKSEDLAAEVFDVAMTDRNTRDTTNPERYGLLAFVAEEPDYVGQTSFQFEGKPNRFSAAFDDTEPPNIKGQTAQSMRHSETMHKMMVQMSEATVGSVLTENARLRQRITELEMREDEVRRKRDEVLDQADERELRNAKQLMRAKREDQFGGMLLSMAPAVLATVFGKKGLPGAASSAMEQAVRSFMQNLDEKEISGILGALKPQNQMVLMEVYKNFRHEAVIEDKGKPKILRAALEESAA